MPRSSSNISKNLLFALVVCVLFFPMLQQFFQFIEVRPLDGAYNTPEQPNPSANNWFEGDFQSSEEEFLNHTIGFKPFFVRLYNQMCYSLYNQARAANAIVGKNDYLYEGQYLNSYVGQDFIGRDSIQLKIKKLQRLSDTLSKKGIDIIVLLAPGKADFYPEYIPDWFDTQHKSLTNYEVYQEELRKTDIHTLDFKDWFMKMKPDAQYPLFPKTGTHWSVYGATLAADSLIKYINYIHPQRHIPSLQIEDIVVSTTMQHPDDDIEKGMNLLFDIPDLPMAYPSISIPKGENNPKVLTIADSFYWNLFNLGLSRLAFEDGQFWFYNVSIHPMKDGNPTQVSELNMREEVEKNDVIILLSTDTNLRIFAFGFVDQLYDTYFVSTTD